jgi:hypothetical protein
VVARTDTFATLMNKELQVNALLGLLQNDLLLEPGFTSSRIVSAPQFGQLYLAADGSFFYQPQTDFQGIDQFSYELVNGVHRSAATVVQLQVSDANNRIGFVQLYPNPTAGESEIRAAVPMQEVGLYTPTGAFLQRWEPNARRFMLDLRDLAQGLYLLRVQAGDAVVFRKIIIQKP